MLSGIVDVPDELALISGRLIYTALVEVLLIFKDMYPIYICHWHLIRNL